MRRYQKNICTFELRRIERDLIGIVDHIVDVTQGDINAALRRFDEVDVMQEAIKDNPASGVRLGGAIDG